MWEAIAAALAEIGEGAAAAETASAAAEAATVASEAASAAEGAGAVAEGAGAVAEGADTLGAATEGAESLGASESTGAGAETVSDVPTEMDSDVMSQGGDQVEGPDSTGGESSVDTTTAGEEGTKKGFGAWADNALNKYNQLHGGDAEKWGNMSGWEKTGKTVVNGMKDYEFIKGLAGGDQRAQPIQPNMQNAGQVSSDERLKTSAVNTKDTGLLSTAIDALGLGPGKGGVSAPQFSKAKDVSSNKNEMVTSDERCKDIDGSVDPIDCFAQIDSYLYRYKPEVVEAYNGHEPGSMCNDKQNFGVMAQDLQANPLTRAAVQEDENGYLMLDGGRLSSINSAMIAELCKKVQELEEYIYGRK